MKEEMGQTNSSCNPRPGKEIKKKKGLKLKIMKRTPFSHKPKS
jgi:hypothetical protein